MTEMSDMYEKDNARKHSRDVKVHDRYVGTHPDDGSSDGLHSSGDDAEAKRIQRETEALRDEKLGAIKPVEDYKVKMARAWEGPSNSGVAHISGKL